MAKKVVKNVVETEFTSRGAEKVAKQTETVGRNQTRMAQASASAGRSFAAQASGLGGLVGVYAAAAANVFAITAAFEALGRAAQAEQIVRGTKTLAIEIGAAGQTILEEVQKITQGQLTLAESAQNINIALSAGFNTSQIEELSEISLKASRALGRNLTDAFQRVVRGAAKLEPELLDELGIFTRIDPAVEAYANRLGVAASSLTNFEKRQAFVNAVIEEGQKKFGSIDTTLDTTQKKFEQLRVQLTELAIEFGQLTANVLGPLVDFLNNNLGAALLLFGGILSLVFGRAVQAIGGFVSNSIGKLGTLADFIADKAKFPLDRLVNLQKTISQPLGQGGLSGIRTAPVIGQDAAQAARFKEAIEAQRSGAISTASQLNRVNRAYKEQIKLLERTGRTGTKSYAALNAAITANNAALKTGGARILAFTTASNLLTVAVKGAAFAFGLLATAVNFLFIGLAVTQLVGTLFDVDILAKIKGFFVDLSQAAAELKSGLSGAVEASGEGTIADFLTRIGLSKDVLEDIPDLIKDINTELRNLNAKTQPAANQAAIDAGAITDISPSRNTSQFKEDLSALQQRTFALQGLLALEEKKTNKDELRIELLKRLIKATNDFGQAETLLAGVGDFLGISTAEVLRLNRENLTVNKELDQVFSKFLPKVNLFGKRFSDLDEDQQDVISSGTLLLKVLEDAEKSFGRGAANAETLSKKIGGLKLAIQDVREAGGVVSSDDLRRLNRLIKQQAELKELEIIGKALVDTYGKFGQALDKAVQSGAVANGRIANSAEEQAANQAQFLALQAGIIKGTNEQKEIVEALATKEEDRNANQIQLLINAERARKAIQGLALETNQALDRELRARQKIRDQLERQLELLEQQNVLSNLRADQAISQERMTQRVNMEQKSLDIAKARLDNSKLENEELKRQQDIKVKTLNLELDALRKIQGIRASIAEGGANRASRRRQAGIRAAQDALANLEASPNLAGQKAIIEARQKVADEILKDELATLEERRNIAAQDAADQLAVITKRLEINQLESDNIVRRLSDQATLAFGENQLINRREKIEQLRANAEIKQLTDRQAIAAQERIIAQLNIQAQEDKFKLDNEQFKRQTQAIKAQALVVNKLVEILNDPDTAFVKAVEALTDGPVKFSSAAQEINTKNLGLDSAQAEIEALQGTIIQTQKDAADATLNNTMELTNLQIQGIMDRREAERDLADVERDRLLLENSAKVEELNDAKKLLREKASLLGIEIEIINQAFNRRIESINAETDAAISANKKVADENARNQDVIRNALEQISGTVNSSLVSGFQELNDAFIEGTLTFDRLKNGFRDFAEALIKDIQRIFFTETIAKPAANFLTESLGLSTSATGGAVVKMASGGMLRDRVPALLEPGEFVIRKPMAKAIGGPALNAMNATGSMPGNVSINIQNDGTPKDAEASQPRFDGEKFVVDIVMRDLRNNGPIRKSLRAGG